MEDEMDLIKIDEKTCTSDGICAAACPAGLINMRPGEFPEAIEGAEEICIRCGHCVASCPTASLTHLFVPVKKCQAIRDDLKISFEQCGQFLKSRRSIRSYRDKPVSRKDIQRLIDVAAYAPSGHNTRLNKWLVIDGRDELKRLSGIVIDWMRFMLSGMREFAVSMHMDRTVERWEAGKDVILRKAPAVVVAYDEINNPMAASSCTIALTYLELAAHGMGLGACWAGYFNSAAVLFPPMKEALGLPESYQCYGSMMIGYPKFDYYRMPVRTQPDISWR
jgi:nitroreductase/NAD-dependent dihydropyrimidine dehydrogenase PreA subunit